MFEPVRGGTRGGQAEFKWSDVSADKDRENYLGHSINAPTGRWQKNSDIHWYSRDVGTGGDREEEINKIKAIEADALAVALGFGPQLKPQGAATSANAVPVASFSNSDSKPNGRTKDEKRAKKGPTDLKELPHRNHNRSRSPRFRSSEQRLGDKRRPRIRSRTSPRERRNGSSRHDDISSDYDSFERERERENDRRRWDLNNRSRTSPRERRTGSSRHDINSDYDSFERERERENDRRRWDLNNRSRTSPRERRTGSSGHDINSDYHSFERENDRRRWDLNNARQDTSPDKKRF